MKEWKYIGDGVYANYNGHELKLCTSSHEDPDNTIYLDPIVWNALVRFMERCKSEGQQPRMPMEPDELES